MRVAFDARDVLRPRTGVVNHTRHLLEALSQARGEHAVVPYVDRSATGNGALSSIHLRSIPGPPVLWKHLVLPLAMAADRVDLFHSPSGTLPLWSPCPMVVTVHDLFAEINPSWFPPRIGMQLRHTIRHACLTAKRIIAVSEATRRDIARFHGIPHERIQVIHNAVDPSYSPSDDREAQEQLRQRYVGGARFVLYIGSRFPWRNVTRLVEAFGVVKRRSGLKDYRLLIVGRDIWGTDRSPARVERLGLSREVLFAGYVPPEHLPVLYRASAALAYPSLYEGFGIPPLEAMASGTPVLTSARGGLAEVVGEAALLADPEDVESLAAGLEQIVSDGALRERLRALGLARAGQFSWQRAAQQTWDVYEAACRS